MSRQKHPNQCSLKILKNFSSITRPLFHSASNSRFPLHQRPISGDKLNNVMARSSVCIYIYIHRAVWTYTVSVNKNDTGDFLECREIASFYGASGTVLSIIGKFIITFLSSVSIHAFRTYFQSAECSGAPKVQTSGVYCEME